MTAYYNEFDKNAAAWLRQLIAEGHIAPGIVDDRSIEDVYPSDLQGFTQCHFFAGIGVWSYALRRAGWSDDRPVWTGSCPCQPFSAAGQGAAFADERHLWPAFQHLISQCKPASVFGEQVASKDADAWVDLVHTDLEALGYAFGAVAFPSAGIGAPHIRDRTYWVGHADQPGPQGHAGHGGAARRSGSRGPAAEAGVSVRLADLHGDGRDQAGECVAAAGRHGTLGDRATVGMSDAEHDGHHRPEGAATVAHRDQPEQRVSDGDCTAGRLADTELQQRQDRQSEVGRVDAARGREQGAATATGLRSNSRPGPTNGFWGTADWLGCRDGKWRPASPKPQPLVDGSAESLGRVRPDVICAIEEEVNAWSVESQVERGQAMRNLLENLRAQAQQCWAAGRIPGLHEAPFLLAFMRQLTEQGWGVSECLPVSRQEAAQAAMRGLRIDGEQASTPCGHELEKQSAGEHPNAVSFLSSLLARHAREAWTVAYEAYAETAHPLANGAKNRVLRLRGYGNAVNAVAAQVFIEAVMESV